MARWGDLAQWRGPSPHRYADGMVSGGRSRGLVVHIASGFYDGTIAWQLDASANDPTSSHFVIARDGRIAQMLDTADASWAQATGNRTWHSAEFEGFAVDDPQHTSHPGWERLTDAQIVAAGRLFARGHAELGWPLQIATSPAGAGLGHHSMGAPDWGHAFCPGDPIISQKAAILAAAQGGSPTPTPTKGGADMIVMAHEKGNNQDYAGNGVFRWHIRDADHRANTLAVMGMLGDPNPTSREFNPGTLDALGPVLIDSGTGVVPAQMVAALGDAQLAALAAQVQVLLKPTLDVLNAGVQQVIAHLAAAGHGLTGS